MRIVSQTLHILQQRTMTYHRRLADKVLVATCIGQLSQPFLQPSRSIRCITDESGCHFTQDLLVLLQNIDIEHPVGQYIREVCHSFVSQYKTGSAYLLYFISSWTKAAQLLCDMGIPSALVIELLRNVVEECIDHTATLRVEVKDALNRERKDNPPPKKPSDSCDGLNSVLDSYRKSIKEQKGHSPENSINNLFNRLDDDNKSITKDTQATFRSKLDGSKINDSGKLDTMLTSGEGTFNIPTHHSNDSSILDSKGIDNIEGESSQLNLTLDQHFIGLKGSLHSVTNEKKDMNKLKIIETGEERTQELSEEDNLLDECKKVLSAYESHRHLEPPCTQPPVSSVAVFTSLNKNIGLSQSDIVCPQKSQYSPNEDEESIDGIKIVRLKLKDRGGQVEEEEIQDDISWFFKQEGDHISSFEQDKNTGKPLSKPSIEKEEREIKESEQRHADDESKLEKYHGDIRHILEQTNDSNGDISIHEVHTAPGSDKLYQDMHESYEDLREELKALKNGIELDIETVKQKKKQYAHPVTLGTSDEFDACFDEVDDEFDTCFDNSVKRSVGWNGLTTVHNEDIIGDIDSGFQEVKIEFIKSTARNDDERDKLKTLPTIATQNANVCVSKQEEIEYKTSVFSGDYSNLERREAVNEAMQPMSSYDMDDCTSGFQEKQLNTSRERHGKAENKECYDSNIYNSVKENNDRNTTAINVMNRSSTHMHETMKNANANSLGPNYDQLVTDSIEMKHSSSDIKVFDNDSDDEFESSFDKPNKSSGTEIKTSDSEKVNKIDDKTGKVTMLGLDNLLQGLGKAVKKTASSMSAISLSSRHMIEDREICDNKICDTNTEISITKSKELEKDNQKTVSMKNDKSRGESNKVLSAYEFHRHLEPCCPQPSKCFEHNVGKDYQEGNLSGQKDYTKLQNSEEAETHTNTGVTVEGINDLLKRVADDKVESKSLNKSISSILLRSRHFQTDDADIDEGNQMFEGVNQAQAKTDKDMGDRNGVLQFVADLNIGLDEKFHSILADIILKYTKGKNLCLPLQYVHVCGLAGGYQEPRLVDGVVLKMSHSLASMVYRLYSKSCRVLLVNADIKSTYKHKGYKAMNTTTVLSAKTFTEHVTKRDKWIQEVSETLEELSINAVLARGSISDDFHILCEGQGVVAMEFVPYQQLTLISEAAKVTMATYITLATEDNICADVTISPWDQDHMTGKCIKGICQHAIILNLSDGNPQTVVIQNHIQTLVDLEEEAFLDSLYRTSSALSSGYVLPGAGTTEAACAQWCYTRAEELIKTLDKPSLGDMDLYLPTAFEFIAKSFQEYARLIHEQCGHFVDKSLDCVYDDYNTKVEALITALDTVCSLMMSDIYVMTGIPENQYSRLGNGIL